ncbi:MAG TPA: alpha/beta hydrolase [Streptosporangiaceae bacterium]|jgi:pimeloyl-ACP methyl ester carboxylesterase
MANFVLVPGAGGSAWYWHRLVPELRVRGHHAVAVGLPAADDNAGLADYEAAVVEAAAGLTAPVLVASSLAGFTVPQVCPKLGASLLVLLNAMVPRPGETAGEWFSDTGHAHVRSAAPSVDDFFHDVPADVTAEAMAQGEPRQSMRPMSDPWPLAAWPDVPTRFLQARDDRFFPLEFQRRVVTERLGIPLDEMPGGHLVALSRPVDLATRLDSYLT